MWCPLDHVDVLVAHRSAAVRLRSETEVLGLELLPGLVSELVDLAVKRVHRVRLLDLPQVLRENVEPERRERSENKRGEEEEKG